MLWADLVDCDGKNRPTGPEISETGHADLLIKFTPPCRHLVAVYVSNIMILYVLDIIKKKGNLD